MNSFLVIGIFILGIALYLGMQNDEYSKIIGNITCNDFPNLCENQIRKEAPKNQQNTKFPYGRWNTPETNLDNIASFGNPVQRFFAMKTWSYVSVATPKYYIAITPAQFNYIEDVFISVVDREAEKSVFDYHWQLPGGLRLKLSPTSVSGCTTFSDFFGNVASICHDNGEYQLSISASKSGKKFECDITFSRGEDAFILWYPLGANPNRPAYVHKEAGMAAHGVVRWDGQEDHRFKIGAATIDWTKSLALRETKWRWVSSSEPSATVATKSQDGESKNNTKHVGINFSNLVYDITHTDGRVASTENVIWIDHKAFLINTPVDILLPDGDPAANPWTVRASGDGTEINLRFTPHGLRQDNTGHEYLPVLSKFVQPFGCFHGIIKIQDPVSKEQYTIYIDNTYGVVENHWAKW